VLANIFKSRSQPPAFNVYAGAYVKTYN